MQKCQQQEPSFASDQSQHSPEAPGLSVILWCTSMRMSSPPRLVAAGRFRESKDNSVFNPIVLNEKKIEAFNSNMAKKVKIGGWN